MRMCVKGSEIRSYVAQKGCGSTVVVSITHLLACLKEVLSCCHMYIYPICYPIAEKEISDNYVSY